MGLWPSDLGPRLRFVGFLVAWRLQVEVGGMWGFRASGFGLRVLGVGFSFLFLMCVGNEGFRV